jgi:flagellar motor protein MotB
MTRTQGRLNFIAKKRYRKKLQISVPVWIIALPFLGVPASISPPGSLLLAQSAPLPLTSGSPNAATTASAITNTAGVEWRGLVEKFRVELIKNSNFQNLKILDLVNKSGEVEITLGNDNLFFRGSAKINATARTDLKRLVEFLHESSLPLKISIESHTDDRPVMRYHHLYSSNWELSAARSAALAATFIQFNYPKANLAAVGFAESRPISQDQNMNRRIVLRLSVNSEEQRRKKI